MAKSTAEYFSHDTDASLDEKIIYLESLFGDSGYAWFFKMLETLGRSNDFEIEWSELKCGVLARKFNTTQQEFNKFIVAATNPDVRAFVIENGKLYSPGLKNRLEKMLERRRKEASRLAEKRANGIVGATNQSVAATNAQSKVKESKVKESKIEVEKTRAKNDDAKNQILEILDEKKTAPPVPAAPPGESSIVEGWIAELSTDYRILDGFRITNKIPEHFFSDYVERFTALARTAPEKYARRQDLIGHFLNWSRIQHSESQRGTATGAPPKPAKSGIVRYENDRPALKEKQAF